MRVEATVNTLTNLAHEPKNYQNRSDITINHEWPSDGLT